MTNGLQPVKITVLKKLDTGKISEKYGSNVESVCPLWEEGREFMVKDLVMPADFCS